MAIYQHGRQVNQMELEAILTPWPTTDAESSTPATHADVKSHVDFDPARQAVADVIATDAKLVAAGVSVAVDALAPSWVAVTLPADSNPPYSPIDGEHITFWEDWADNLVNGQGAEYVERVYPVSQKDDEGNEVTPLVVVSKSGSWRVRDRYDRWIGPVGYLTQISAEL